jgi:hypothetical protein
MNHRDEKTDNVITIKIPDSLLAQIKEALVEIDTDRSSLIRTSVIIGLPVVINHPALIKSLDRDEEISTVKR